MAFAPAAALAQSSARVPGAETNIAAAGSTTFIKSGSYGTAAFNNISNNPVVTVHSATGEGANMRPTFAGANGITADSVTQTSAGFSGTTTNNAPAQRLL